MDGNGQLISFSLINLRQVIGN